jgi:lipopolysaccharide transport system ATP-binding protein
MSEIVIRAESLSKMYRIGQRERENALRNVLGSMLRAPWKLLKREKKETFWALKDVDLEVKQGEVLGLIGRNGAGKTTLLKILSRVTRPTLGWAEIYGRVGTLLEVGTGFHPELSGRDNTYLSGAILGMGRQEIDRKFDEIVAFAEIEKFIDVPVKHYSSGMYVRLAFAVAAHLEPEILLVDEVLAVGDIAFQKKCLGKMGDVAKEGRTILFVSHNVTAITRLCNRCVLMQGGTVIADGATHDVVTTYLRSEMNTSARREWTAENAPGDSIVRLREVRVRTEEGRIGEAFDIRRPIGIDLVFDVLEGGKVLAPNIHIFNGEGITLFISIDEDATWLRQPRPAGRYVSTCWIPGNFLAEGSLVADVAITTFVPFEIHSYERGAVGFEVIDSIDGDSVRGDYAGHLPGVVRPSLEWETAFEPHRDERQVADQATRG